MATRKKQSARRTGKSNGVVLEAATGQSSNNSSVRIVALGASAGGLEPCERFFDATSPESGLAYVIIQHLSPDFKSLMDEILARHSSMPIYRVEDGMSVEANTIYLNSPRSAMEIVEGRFVLKPPERKDAISLPINTFFESLAAECGEDAIAVVLSGTGTDGTKGCQAIKAAGGSVFVMEPSSAKFDGMPDSVINAGLADAIVRAEVLPEIIRRHIAGEELPGLGEVAAYSGDPMSMIYEMLRERYGTDFSLYKSETIERRIRRRCDLSGFSRLEDYVERMKSERDELETLYNDLLIEVTAFFRDEEAFQLLESEIIPSIAAAMSDDHQIRIWVPGCASGEEAYSIAILLAEYARTTGTSLNVKILATDIHERSLGAASAGIYSEANVKGIGEERISRYFEKVGGYYQVRPLLRRLVVFSPHNLLRDPPFNRMDLVSCRNVLIYLNDAAQQKAIALFHFSLRKGAYLFLGPSESVGALSSELKTINRRWRIFQKARDVRLLETTPLLPSYNRLPGAGGGKSNSDVVRVPPTASSARPDARRAINVALESLLSAYAPPGFLIGSDGELVHIFGDASRYLSLKEGGFSRRLVDLMHTDLKLVLGAGLDRMRSGFPTPFVRNAKVAIDKGNTNVTLRIESLEQGSARADYFLVSIIERTEAPTAAPASEEPSSGHDDVSYYRERIADLENDLQSTEQSLQTTIEELETSNEELQATNEELMASNEELQSTNEELHSVNEELHTVSSEHQRKIEELTEVTSDMDHLLKSTEIGTIFLDKSLNIRRFTPATLYTFNLIAQDVGRPLSHVTHRFKFDDLIGFARNAIELNRPDESEIYVDDKVYLLRVLPYLQTGDEPVGAVITAIDITELRQAEKAMSAMSKFHSDVLSDIAEFVVRWRACDEKITYCNKIYANLEGRNAEKIVGNLLEDDPLGDEHKTFVDDLAALAPGETTRSLLSKQVETGKTQWRECVVRAIGDEDGGVVAFQATGRDATSEVRYIRALEDLIHISDIDVPSYSERLHKLLKVAVDYLGADHALLTRLSECNLSMTAYVGKDPDQFGPAEDAVARLQAMGPMLCDYISQQSEPTSEAQIAQIEDSEGAWCSLPIYPSGVHYGHISFYRAAQTKLSALEQSFFSLLARWLGYKIERNNQFEEIARKEAELRLVFNSVPSRIFVKDGQGNYLRANKAAALSVGKKISEIEGQNTASLFPGVADKYQAYTTKALSSGKPITGIVERFAPVGGPEGWVRADVVPYEDAATGEPRLLIVATDVTELKNANEELERQQARYLELYRKTPSMMHSIDTDGRITEVSDLWLSTFGYKRTEVVGKMSMDFMTETSKENSRVLLPKFWEKGFAKQADFQFVHKNGDVIDIELSGYVADKNSSAPRGLDVLVDVTERNRAIAALRHKNRELETANEGLARFAYAASHDLQEPLRKIRQFGDLLKEENSDELSEDAGYYIDVMRQSAARMSHLVGKVLQYSTLSNKQLELSKCKLEKVVRQVVEDLDVAIAEADAVVEVGKLPTIECDAAQASQLFANLISNSIKYRCPDRAPHVLISSRTSNARGEKTFIIEITDNGVGFDPALLPRMLEAFVRLDRQRSPAGAGIGLAICRTVCDRHRWKLDATSKVGRGSTFTIKISQ